MNPNEAKCTLTDSELAEKCKDWINNLCKSGGKDWCLRVPADHNHDPDLLFGELIKRFTQKPEVSEEVQKDFDRMPEIEHPDDPDLDGDDPRTYGLSNGGRSY